MTDSQTEDTYPNAGRASGYTDGRGNDIGENIVNRVTELMVAPQTKIIQLATQLSATVELQDQRFQYLLNQMSALLDKEDMRHGVYDAAEASTLQALTSVATRLDEITGYVQQSVTLARKGIDIGEQALAIGRDAQQTGLEALSIARSALGVSESNAKRLGHVEQKFIEVEKTVMALKKGQSLSDEQTKRVMKELAELRSEIAALRAAADLAARVAAQAAEHERRLAAIEAWKAAFEARG